MWSDLTEHVHLQQRMPTGKFHDPHPFRGIRNHIPVPNHVCCDHSSPENLHKFPSPALWKQRRMPFRNMLLPTFQKFLAMAKRRCFLQLHTFRMQIFFHLLQTLLPVLLQIHFQSQIHPVHGIQDNVSDKPPHKPAVFPALSVLHSRHISLLYGSTR